MRPIPRLAALAALVAAGVSCGGGGNESTEPTPGDLTINLETPNSDDAAIRLTIRAPIAPSAITKVSAGSQLFVGSIGTTTTVILTGELGDGPLLRITVLDTRKDADYSATVEEVASTTFALRNSGTYSLSVEK